MCGVLHLDIFAEVVRHEAERCPNDATERIRLQLEGVGFRDNTDVELSRNLEYLESLKE